MAGLTASDLAALHEFLTHGYVVGEQSILDGIRRLPPAPYASGPER